MGGGGTNIVSRNKMHAFIFFLCLCFVAPMEQGPVTRVHGLIGWDNKGALQHIAKMNYMTERADRLERLGVSVSCCW